MARILLIDDDEDYASIIRMRLEKEGYQVEWDSNPIAAGTRLDHDFHFDLIIMDVEMPEQNGLAGLIHLKSRFDAKRPGGFNIPVMMATGMQSEKLRTIFESQDVADYLHKPFESSELVGKVEKILAKKG